MNSDTSYPKGLVERISEIPGSMTKLLNKRADALADLLCLEEDALRIATKAIPDGGWPGKNEEQRRDEKNRSLLSNESFQQVQGEIMDQRTILLYLDADIKALEMTRWSLEQSVLLYINQKGTCNTGTSGVRIINECDGHLCSS